MPVKTGLQQWLRDLAKELDPGAYPFVDYIIVPTKGGGYYFPVKAGKSTEWAVRRVLETGIKRVFVGTPWNLIEYMDAPSMDEEYTHRVYNWPIIELKHNRRKP